TEEDVVVKDDSELFLDFSNEEIFDDFEDEDEIELEEDLDKKESTDKDEGSDTKKNTVDKKKSDKILERAKKKEAEIIRKAEQVLEEAKVQAEKIISQAQLEAENIKKNAYTDGMKKGIEEGTSNAYNENSEILALTRQKTVMQLKEIVERFSMKKEQIMTATLDELRDVSLAVAEKVVQVSLKSSGEVIKRMIVSATEKLSTKEWAKIYISKEDSAALVNAHVDILDCLANVSEHIKIMVVENGSLGTCIIELPDQIIDASASTQLENIKNGIINGNDFGGNDV
ncbi:MAG: FliH/SctL family protein, partial [Anaerotignaceae bacterium]